MNAALRLLLLPISMLCAVSPSTAAGESSSPAAGESSGANEAAGESSGSQEPSGEPGRFSRSVHTFFADGRYLFTFPARANAKGVWLSSAFIAGTLLLIEQDDSIRRNVLESNSRTTDDLADLFEPLGRSEVEAAALGIAWLWSKGAGNSTALATSSATFEAYLWTLVVTSVAKGAFGRERPSGDTDAHRFFEGDTIFPSGHTSRSFAIAAVLADRHGRAAAAIAYPVAALIGLSTIRQDTHWASDLLAGAGLGLAIGKGIAARHRARERRPGRPGRDVAWQISPTRSGATLRFSF